MGRLDNIQVARGLAAAMVVVQHSVAQLNNHPIAGMRSITLFSEKGFGNGVDLFFVISGFIMVYITANRRGSDGSPWSFFLNRLMRVAPLYWIFTVLMIAVATVTPGSVNEGIGSTWQVVASFLFIPAPRADGLMHPVLGLGWTLNYEFFFYTCFAFSMLLPRAIGPFVVALLFAALAIANPVMGGGILGFWSDPIILEFVLGMGIALLFLRGMRLTPGVAVLVGAGGLAAGMYLPGAVPWAHRVFVSGVPSAFVIAAFALAPQRAWPAIPMAIGNASYALYLSHPFALNVTTKAWQMLRLPNERFLYAAALCIAALVAGYLVHRLVERPIERVARRMRGRGDRQDDVSRTPAYQAAPAR